MKVIFVESKSFEKYRSDCLSDDGYLKLQNELLVNPSLGDVIQGSGGLRKIRTASKVKLSEVVHESYTITLIRQSIFIF